MPFNIPTIVSDSLSLPPWIRSENSSSRRASRRVNEGEKDDDDNDEVTGTPLHRLTSFDVWALGISIVIGGQYYKWNSGLEAGFGSYAIGTGLMAILYACICICNAELSSAVPFAGGAYGLARLSLGLYAGFVIGCCEALEFILYVAEAALNFSKLVAIATGTSENLIPLYCAVFYSSALFVHVYGGTVFWRVNTLIALVSVLIILIFILGSAPYANFHQNASLTVAPGGYREEGGEGIDDGWFIGGVPMFLRAFPVSAWFFVGVESLNFACVFVEKPKVVIPRGSLACILTLILTAFGTLFVSCSVYPGTGIVSSALMPLKFGFASMFHGRVSDRGATALALPATYGTAFGFMFSYSRVLQAMSRSGLVPKVFSHTFGPNKTPAVALLFGSIVGYIICIILYVVPSIEGAIFNATMLSAFSAYISQFIGFIIFRTDFPNQKRLFRSPLGIWGAIIGSLIAALGMVSIVAFQKDKYIAIVSVACVICIMSVYYYFYARKKQTFSPEEQIIFRRQIAIFNERVRDRITFDHGGGNSNSSSDSGKSSGRGRSLFRRVFRKHMAPLRRNLVKLARFLQEDDDGQEDGWPGMRSFRSARGEEQGEEASTRRGNHRISPRGSLTAGRAIASSHNNGFMARESPAMSNDCSEHSVKTGRMPKRLSSLMLFLESTGDVMDQKEVQVMPATAPGVSRGGDGKVNTVVQQPQCQQLPQPPSLSRIMPVVSVVTGCVRDFLPDGNDDKFVGGDGRGGGSSALRERASSAQWNNPRIGVVATAEGSSARASIVQGTSVDGSSARFSAQGAISVGEASSAGHSAHGTSTRASSTRGSVHFLGDENGGSGTTPPMTPKTFASKSFIRHMQQRAAVAQLLGGSDVASNKHDLGDEQDNDGSWFILNSRHRSNHILRNRSGSPSSAGGGGSGGSSGGSPIRPTLSKTATNAAAGQTDAVTPTVLSSPRRPQRRPSVRGRKSESPMPIPNTSRLRRKDRSSTEGDLGQIHDSNARGNSGGIAQLTDRDWRRKQRSSTEGDLTTYASANRTGLIGGGHDDLGIPNAAIMPPTRPLVCIADRSEVISQSRGGTVPNTGSSTAEGRPPPPPAAAAAANQQSKKPRRYTSMAFRAHFPEPICGSAAGSATLASRAHSSGNNNNNNHRMQMRSANSSFGDIQKLMEDSEVKGDKDDRSSSSRGDSKGPSSTRVAGISDVERNISAGTTADRMEANHSNGCRNDDEEKEEEEEDLFDQPLHRGREITRRFIFADNF